MSLWHRDRIANQVFDDPPRVLPPEPEKAKVALEMDDKKSHKVCIPHAHGCVTKMCYMSKAVALNAEFKCAMKFAFLVHLDVSQQCVQSYMFKAKDLIQS